MKELEVGMYVRTNGGYICKLININDFREPGMKYGIEANYLKDIVFIGDEDISKASYNIIDLIKVGDYVNGYKVLEICTGNFELNNPLNIKALKLEFIKEDINPNIPFFKRYNAYAY